MYCTACLSATHCTECSYRYYVSRQNTCVQKCLNELLYYGQPRPTCSTCPYDCLTCNIYGECLTCNASEFRQLNPRNYRCEPMFGYHDTGKISCELCAPHCFKCLTLWDCDNC
jgi:hypothetical protein